jgi:hypothetical protein
MLRIIQEKFRTEQQKMAQCAGSFRMQIRLSFNSFTFSLPLSFLFFATLPFLHISLPLLSTLYLSFSLPPTLSPLYPSHHPSLFLPLLLPLPPPLSLTQSSFFSLSTFSLSLHLFLPPSLTFPPPLLPHSPPFIQTSLSSLPSFSGFSMGFLPHLSIILSTPFFPLPFLLSFACFSRYLSHFIFSTYTPHLLSPPLSAVRSLITIRLFASLLIPSYSFIPRPSLIPFFTRFSALPAWIV